MSIDQRLVDVAHRVIPQHQWDRLTVQSQLFEDRFLDSFGMLRLVSELETEFAITFLNEDLIPQNFSALADIAVLLERYHVRNNA